VHEAAVCGQRGSLVAVTVQMKYRVDPPPYTTTVRMIIVLSVIMRMVAVMRMVVNMVMAGAVLAVRVGMPITILSV